MTTIDEVDDDALPIIETSPVQVHYVHRLLRVEVCGPNFRATFCEVKTVDGVRARVPVVDIVQPIATFRPLRLAEAITKARRDGDCEALAIVH